jgi:hypothetical protein
VRAAWYSKWFSQIARSSSIGCLKSVGAQRQGYPAWRPNQVIQWTDPDEL